MREVMSEVGEKISDSGYSERLDEAVYDEIDKHLSRGIKKGLEIGLLQKRETSPELDKEELSL